MSTGAIEKIKVNGEEHEIAGIHLNSNGNREFYSEGLNAKNEPQKVNVLSAGDIQIKTGDDSVLQLDCESNSATGASGDPNEYKIKICNGEFNKTKRVVAAKVNVAEIILDNQNANTTDNKFDLGEIKIKYRHDTKDEAVYAKHMASSFDFRCVKRDGSMGRAHGGIAFQIAGADNSGNENKIKFESNRTSAITAAPVYTGDGGDGLEFGTFNNVHSSLFSKDYRFNADGKIYPSTRTITTTSGKTDYVTQPDDFKDIIDASRCATWGKIVDVVKDADETAISLIKTSSKGNFQINNIGKYTYEANFDLKDESGVDVSAGYRILTYTNESYYTDSSKYCYKAKKNAKDHNNVNVTKGKIVLWSDASVYLTSDALTHGYIDSATVEQYYAVDASTTWTKTPFWKQNDVNINLESSSKIKLQGSDLEVINEDAAGETIKMDSVTIETEKYKNNSSSMKLDSSTITFECEITDGVVVSGHDPLIRYKVTTDGTVTTDASIRLSTLLGLEARVYALEHPQA